MQRPLRINAKLKFGIRDNDAAGQGISRGLRIKGNRSITRLDDAAEATFKQLVEEDGKRLLKALNPEWSPRYLELNVEATYCGKVIGKWVPE